MVAGRVDMYQTRRCLDDRQALNTSSYRFVRPADAIRRSYDPGLATKLSCSPK